MEVYITVVANGDGTKRGQQAREANAGHVRKIAGVGGDQKKATFQALRSYQRVRKALGVPVQPRTGHCIGIGKWLDAEFRQDFVQI